jgi:hypothetical protein
MHEISTIKLQNIKNKENYLPNIKRSILLAMLGVVKLKNLLLKDFIKNYIVNILSEGILEILCEIINKFIYCNDTIYYCLWIIQNISYYYYYSYVPFLNKNYLSVYISIFNKRNENGDSVSKTLNIKI